MWWPAQIVQNEDMPPPRRTPCWVLPVLVIALGLGGCSGDRGQREAEQRLDAAAHSLAGEARQNWRRTRTDSTWLAIWAADDSGRSDARGDGDVELTVRPLSWRQLPNGDGEVDVAIEVTTPAHSAKSFGDRSYSAGRATGCRRIGTDGTVSPLTCAGRPTPVVPSPPAIPELDVQTTMIKAALDRPDIDDVRRYAQARAGTFAVQAEIVDTSRVLVLTRPRPYACLAGVRGPGGRTRMITPDPRVMQPGEGACDPHAILHPVRTR